MIRLPITFSIFPSFVNMTPRHFLHSGQDLVLFPARDHGLGFGGVDSPSHLPAGCSNENCASPSDEANRTTSSAKSRDKISPKWVPSTLCPSLGYEHNWWQRATWWSPAVTGNVSELLPAMLTKLWTLAICCLV